MSVDGHVVGLADSEATQLSTTILHRCVAIEDLGEEEDDVSYHRHPLFILLQRVV